jgi:hypothetical protein
MGFTSREQLIQSIRDWKAKKPGNLGILLLELGALSEHTKSLLDALVEEHLAQHDNDAVKSLATLSTIGSLGDELKTLEAPDVNATLAHLPTRVSKNSTKASQASSYPSEAIFYGCTPKEALARFRWQWMMNCRCSANSHHRARSRRTPVR